MADHPILFHVGYIKTATTFLQDVAFSGAYGDLELAAGKDTRSQVVHNILLADDYQLDAERVLTVMEAFAADVRARGKFPVWSEEMLLGNPPSRSYWGFANARKVHAVYPHAKILITIRRQQSIALSMYREYILGGGALPLSSFIGTGKEPRSFSPILRTDFLHFDRAIRHYTQLFGQENVLVLPQEMLKDSPAGYMSKLSGFTGCKFSSDIPTAQSVHRGERIPALVLRRTLNRFILKDPTRPGRQGLDNLVNRFVTKCNRLTPAGLEAKYSRLMKQQIEERYSDLFRTSNREAAKLTGLDLASLGYDT